MIFRWLSRGEACEGAAAGGTHGIAAVTAPAGRLIISVLLPGRAVLGRAGSMNRSGVRAGPLPTRFVAVREGSSNGADNEVHLCAKVAP